MPIVLVVLGSKILPEILAKCKRRLFFTRLSIEVFQGLFKAREGV